MKTLRALWMIALFTAQVAANDAASLIAQGDAFDVKFQAAEALKFYLSAEKLLPNDTALLVKIARQYVYRMDDFSSKSDKISAAKTALDYAERAVKLNPKDSDAHLSVAICVGKLTQQQGNKEKVEGSKRIKDAAEAAVKLNPSNDLAWHLLGRWHQSIAGMGALTRGIASIVYGQMPEASNETSIQCFQKAISLNPSRLIHHVEIGRTYAQMGKAKEARAAIEKGLAMPNREKDDPETKDRGRESLKQL